MTSYDAMRDPHMDAKLLGYINHKPLVWPNECARHKLLDVIGDLALIGKPIKGRIIATRPGHNHHYQIRTSDCARNSACTRYRRLPMIATVLRLWM